MYISGADHSTGQYRFGWGKYFGCLHSGNRYCLSKRIDRFKQLGIDYRLADNKIRNTIDVRPINCYSVPLLGYRRLFTVHWSYSSSRSTCCLGLETIIFTQSHVLPTYSGIYLCKQIMFVQADDGTRCIEMHP